MHIAYLGIGTSMGSRKRNLLFASQLLSAHPQIEIESHSSIWTSTPLGRAQCLFANAVIKIKTSLSPYQLLETCKEFEFRMGRRTAQRWADRLIDIDILTYDQICIASDTLQVPHPEILKRDFVLLPLLELDPNFSLVRDGEPCSLCDIKRHGGSWRSGVFPISYP